MRLYACAVPILVAAAPLITLSDAQVAALDAAAVKACRDFVAHEYPDQVQTRAVGRIRTFGSDEDHDVHYGIIVQVTAADRWMCLYDRDRRTVASAGIIEGQP